MTREEKRAFWEEKIPEYRASGLSGIAWSEKNNLSERALRYWINKFNKERKSNDSTEFKPLIPETAQPIYQSTETTIKVTIGTASIELTKDFDEIMFERVAAILSRQC